jgi:hypothetical protein
MAKAVRKLSVGKTIIRIDRQEAEKLHETLYKFS